MRILRQIRRLMQRWRAKKLNKCGKNVSIDRTAHLIGHIEVGDNVFIGARDNFVSTGATLHIENDVVIAPDVSIYTGDHAIDILGYHISEITDQMKHELGKGSYDRDVTIQSGCWIGTRAIILKGVTIGKGSVIGAGAVVTKDVPPYSVYVGVPSSRTFKRFTEEEVQEHEKLLTQRNKLY